MSQVPVASQYRPNISQQHCVEGNTTITFLGLITRSSGAANTTELMYTVLWLISTANSNEILRLLSTANKNGRNLKKKKVKMEF